MGLPWVRFDTAFPRHDKVLRMVGAAGERGRSAGFVYACALAYIGEAETDGLVPFEALPFVHGTRKHAALLVEHGLWKPHPQGWEVVNWHERNSSSATLKAARDDRSLRARKAACERWHARPCDCWRRSPEDT